jgi:hypothetical protein
MAVYRVAGQPVHLLRLLRYHRTGSQVTPTLPQKAGLMIYRDARTDTMHQAMTKLALIQATQSPPAQFTILLTTTPNGPAIMWCTPPISEAMPRYVAPASKVAGHKAMAHPSAAHILLRTPSAGPDSPPKRPCAWPRSWPSRSTARCSSSCSFGFTAGGRFVPGGSFSCSFSCSFSFRAGGIWSNGGRACPGARAHSLQPRHQLLVSCMCDQEEA